MFTSVMALVLSHASNASNLHEAAAYGIAPLPSLQNQQCGVVEPVTLYLPQTQKRQVLEQLSQWHQHPLAQFVNCFSIQTYHAAQLQCDIVGSRARMDCRWQQTQTIDMNQRRIVFVRAGDGIASSTANQIILPINASLSLFAHEIGHWLGLADEYAMAPELAEGFCVGRYNHASFNVVVTDNTVMSGRELKQLWRRLPWRHAVADWRQLATQINDEQWRLGSAAESVGLHPVATCNAVAGKFAWRPLIAMTPMQYHDINEWPELYLELIAHPR